MQSNTVAANAAAFGATLNYNGNAAMNFLQGQQQQQQQQHLILNQANLIQQQQQQQQVQMSQISQPPIPNQQNQIANTNTTSAKDTTFTKIFVGGLPYHTTDETLKLFFQKFGNIEEAVVITDRSTGKSRGYGFVTMETKEAAESAILDPNPVIDGRKANVNLAYLGVKSRIAQPTNFIPLTIRYPMPTTTATYGFHPFYYHPGSTTATNASTSSHQAAFLTAAHPNLLMTAQTAVNNPGANTLSALTNGGNSSGLFDLSTGAVTQAAYNTHINGFNSNRLSPFENSNHLAATVSNQSPFFSFNAANLSSNLNNQAAALNSVLKTANVTNGSYFALPQHLTTTFQTQLQDRL